MKSLIINIRKNKKYLSFEFLIIIICLIIIFLTFYKNYCLSKIDEKDIESFFKEQKQIIESKNKNDEVIEKQEKVEGKASITNNAKSQVSESYLGVLEIKKIDFIRGFYSIKSLKNNVNKNIQVVKESTMPSEENSNLIIAGHSGNSYTSFFNKLNKLSIGDIASIYYDGNSYNYTLTNVYEIEKNGLAHIVKKNNVKTLTLITCKKNTNKQLVFIFELS